MLSLSMAITRENGINYAPGYSMDGIKKIRWTAGAALASGLTLGVCSGLIEHLSLAKGDSTFLLYCAGLAARLFTLGAVFVVIYVLQSQRAKALSRLEKLEGELNQMRNKLIHLKAFTL